MENDPHAAEATKTGAGSLDDPLPSTKILAPGLSPGSRLGHYQLSRKLGEGGMGWVYEAVDNRLNRTVAVKVLPPGQITEDVRKRFTREAQSASALNHPNIITVYEVGREGEIDFIVMERVAGKTLRQEIGEKGLDSRTALRYASQIADALAAAHDAGIVHRDLKPGNVMVTGKGLVKVLDFGLAKQSSRRHASAAIGATPVDTSLTEFGHVVGTVAYMSPEQAEGKPVDARSDIFAFGSVLFEMFSGRRAFQEESQAGTLAAVLLKEPRLSDLPPSIPHAARRLIERCLQKNPSDRWHHILDVKLQIDDLLKDLDAPPAPGTLPQRRSFGWTGVAAGCLAGALAAAGILKIAGLSKPAGTAEPILRMVTADTGLTSFPALSRDGKLLAFASDRANEGSLDIWLQQIGGRDPIRLTNNPAHETDPAFSPDGTRIAFRSEANGGGVHVMPAIGKADPVLLAPGGYNPRFSPDGKWIAYWTGRDGAFFPGSSQVYIVEAAGGQPRQVQPAMAAALYPVWSPKGDELLALGRRDGTGSLTATLDWWILPIGQGEPRSTGVYPQLRAQKLTEVQFGLRVRARPLEWLGSPHERVLFAAPLGDSANLWEVNLTKDGKSSGAARRVTHGPGRQIYGSWSASEGVERTAFVDETVNFDVWTIPIDAETGVTRGEPKQLTADIAPEWAPSLSWDGKKLAYVSRHAGSWTLRSRDLTQGTDIPLIWSPVQLKNVKFAGDGSRMIYSNRDYHLFSVPVTGGVVDRICEGCGTVTGASSDGRLVIYEPLADEDLVMLQGSDWSARKLAPRQSPDTLISGGQFSRDGKWAAFHSISNPRSAAAQVWIAPVREKGMVQPAEWIPITDGHAFERDPCWSPDGTLLYFVSERDGFRCIWARRLDPTSKQPVREAQPVRHFHSARQSLREVGNDGFLTGLSVGSDRMVFALSDRTGNIWLAEKAVSPETRISD